jgi:hypothetical protein
MVLLCIYIPGAPFIPYGPLPGVPAFVTVPPSPVRILKSRSGAAVPYLEMGGTVYFAPASPMPRHAASSPSTGSRHIPASAATGGSTASAPSAAAATTVSADLAAVQSSQPASTSPTDKHDSKASGSHPLKLLEDNPYLSQETIGTTAAVGATASGTGSTARAPHPSGSGGINRSPKSSNTPSHSTGSSPGFQRQPKQWQESGSIASSAGQQASAKAPAGSGDNSQGSIRMSAALIHSPKFSGSSGRTSDSMPVERTGSGVSAAVAAQLYSQQARSQHQVSEGIKVADVRPAAFAVTGAAQMVTRAEGHARNSSMAPSAYDRSPSMMLLTAIPEAAAEDGGLPSDGIALTAGKGSAPDRHNNGLARPGHSGAAPHHHQQLNSVMDPVVSPGRITIASKVKAARLYSQSATPAHHPAGPAGGSSGGGGSSRLSGSSTTGHHSTHSTTAAKDKA